MENDKKHVYKALEQLNLCIDTEKTIGPEKMKLIIKAKDLLEQASYKRLYYIAVYNKYDSNEVFMESQWFDTEAQAKEWFFKLSNVNMSKITAIMTKGLFDEFDEFNDLVDTEDMYELKF